MATVQKTLRTNQLSDVSSEMLAIGSSGAWQIDIDEAQSSDRWWMQIEGPTLSLYFEIPSLDTVKKMARILGEPSTKSKRPPNGSAKKSGALTLSAAPAQVSLVKDDEFDDRYFIVIGFADHSNMRFTIAGKDLLEITDALHQVEEDLDD